MFIRGIRPACPERKTPPPGSTPGRLDSEQARLHVRDSRAANSTQEVIVAEQAQTQTYNGYCVKCKEKRDFDGHVEISKTGMRMAKGKCPVCDTTMNRILGKA